MKKRRHHFIWQYYLTPWADEQGYVSCSRNGKVFRANRINLGVETDFYRLRDLTDADLRVLHIVVRLSPPELQPLHRQWLAMIRAPFMVRANVSRAELSDEEANALEEYEANVDEDAHGGIEDAAVPLLKELRMGTAAFFAESHGFSTFMHFLSVQFLRTKRMRERFAAMLGQLPGADGADGERISPALCHILATNMTSSFIAFRPHYRLTFLEAPADAEFITSDQPVLNRYADGLPEGQPPNEVLFYYPIGPRSAVLVGDSRSDSLPTAKRLHAREVEDYNARVARNALTQVYGSDQVLQSLVETRPA